MEKSSNQQMEQPQSSKESFFRLAQLLLAGVGIFAALCYFLGRLHVEAYYYALGITPHVLRFKPEDYMFSSFNLVIMCLFVCYWLYTYYGYIKAGERLLFGFPIFRSSNKLGLVKNILMMILGFVFTVSIFLNIYLQKSIGANVPGLLGFSVGFSVGVAAIFCFWFLDTFFSGGVKKAAFVGFFIIGLTLLAWLPSIATTLAKIEVKSDIEKFPKAVLICQNALNPQLQSSPQNPRESMEVKVITNNNGMTYVLKQESESTNDWQVYAIHENDIKQIIYLREK